MNIRAWDLTATLRRLSVLFTVSMLLTACGGGGDNPSPDKTPDPMTFLPASNLLPGTLATSGEVTVLGLGVAVQASISSGGEISVNGGAWTSEPVTVRNDDLIRVRGIAGDAPEGMTEITLTVGESSTAFQIPTAPAGTVADTRPDTFNLPEPDPASVEPGSTVITAPVLVAGVNTGVQASAAGIEGAVLIVDGEPVEGGSATIFPGQSVQISLPAPTASNGVTEAVLTIGGVSEVVTVVTPPAEGELDAVPNPFNGEIPTDVDPDAAEPGQTVVFGPITVSGVSMSVPVVLEGQGGYSLDGGGTWSDDLAINASDEVSDGASILVRIQASEISSVRAEARLIVGGVSTFFAVTTKIIPPGSDTTPEEFSFIPQTGVSPGASVISNAVTITGIDVPAAISIENGEYRINGGQFTATPGVVTVGQEIEVRVTTGDEPGAQVIATLTIGGVSATFTVSTEANLPPVANAGSDRTVDEDTGVTLDGSESTDDDRATLQFAWQAPQGITLSDAAAEKPTFTAPNVTTNTSFTFTLTVTDAGNVTAIDNVTVLVRNVVIPNQPPVANAGPDQSVNEGLSVTLDGSASDDEEDTSLDFTWQAPEGITLSNNKAVSPTFTAPNVSANTPLTFTLIVTDSDNVSHTDDVTINVLFVNNDPIANAGDDQALNEGEGVVVTLTGSGADPIDGGGVTFSWRQLSGKPVTLNNANQATATFAAPDITPADLLNGINVLTFVLEVTDSSDVSDTDTVDVTVNFVNQGPLANAGADRAVNELGSITLSGSGSDPDGGAVTFEWAVITGEGSLTNANAAVATYTAPEVNTTGFVTLRLQVRDSAGAVTEDFASVEVRQVTDVTPDPFDFDDVVATAGQVNFSNTITPTGFKDAATVNVAITSGSIGLASPVINGSPVASGSQIRPGQTLALRVRNGNPGDTGIVQVSIGGRFATVDVAYTVPPVSVTTANPDEVQGGDTVDLDGTQSSDSNGTIVSYAWTQTEGTPADLIGADTASASFVAPIIGTEQETLRFQLIVTDNDGLTDESFEDVIVHAPNTPPVANAGADQTPDEGTTVTLDGSGTRDDDNHTLSYQWVQTEGEPVVLSDDTSESPTFAAPTGLVSDDTEFVFVFELTVNDGHFEGESKDTVSIAVQNTGAELMLDFPGPVALTDAPVVTTSILTYRGRALPGDGPGIESVTVNSMLLPAFDGTSNTYFDSASGVWSYEHLIMPEQVQTVEIVITESNGEMTQLSAMLEHVENRETRDFQVTGATTISSMSHLALAEDKLYIPAVDDRINEFDIRESRFRVIDQSPQDTLFSNVALSVDPAGDRILLGSYASEGSFAFGALGEVSIADGVATIISRDGDANASGVDFSIPQDLAVDYSSNIAYLVDTTNGVVNRLIAVDLTTGARSVLVESLPGRRILVDTDGNRVLLAGCEVSALDLETLALTEIVPEEPDFCALVMDGIDGDPFVYAVNRFIAGAAFFHTLSLVNLETATNFPISDFSDTALGPSSLNTYHDIAYDRLRDVVYVLEAVSSSSDPTGLLMIDLQTGQRVVLFQEGG